jgi:hypothetical protein
VSGLFVTACVLIALGVVTFVIGMTARGKTRRRLEYDDDGLKQPVEGPVVWGKLARWIGLGVTAVGLAFLAGSAMTSVPAQSVGVAVAFGKPYWEYSPGLHWKKPWAIVVDMDGRTQTEVHVAGKEGAPDSRIEIRLGNQATGYVQTSLRWKIRPEAAGSLYADYRAETDVGPKLVDLELAAAMNAAFSDYDPLANVRAEAGDTTAKKISNDELSKAVQTRLDSRIGGAAGANNRIIIEQVVITKVDFDDATQSRINQYQQEVGNTRIAEQAGKTATARATANNTLAASLNKNPNVLVSQCLDQQREMIDKGQPIPIGGIGCWPGGATPSVIVQPK